MPRSAELKRITKETDISLFINIDGGGAVSIDTGIGFLNHMLELTSRHGFIDLNLICKGDIDIDNHHTVEDIGIVLGQALRNALGTKEGIARYSTVFTPMDESLSMIALDISGRPYLYFDVEFLSPMVGGFETELVEEFFRAFVNNAGVTLHIKLMWGKNTHHIIESIFKGFGRVLDEATTLQSKINGVLSTKGVL